MLLMKKIAVLTSGGDAPGMNAAIRAVVRAGIESGHKVIGVTNGFKGLIEGAFRPMNRRSVSGIIQAGGTILGSSRLPEFSEQEVRTKAMTNMNRDGVEALVVIGGNGSQAGGAALWNDGFPVVGIASTIDNDLACSEPTLGTSTAAEIGLEAIDRIKTTASAQHRAFLVETMGRKSGYLALVVGIAGGAEAIVIPEMEMTPEEIESTMRSAYSSGKSHAIVVVAEGSRNNADRLGRYFEKREKEVGFGLRVTKLGYVQRGGCPNLYDRLLGTQLGAEAVRLVCDNSFGRVAGTLKSQIVSTPYDQILGIEKRLDPALFELARVMAK
jgi:6-phosphofructokinase 1